MSPKIIAHYLPQFHDVTENNAWWWEGFTEWTNVKKAKPLYSWHEQPRVPLGEKYYNILDRDIRKWQADIAREHWVDGFCYYHYWFKWGKRLLEKPIELLLEDGEPHIPFCLSWGNGNWARTWEGQPEQILMLQEYGDESDWRAHFDYLLPFFQSDLYIRKEGKPVFLIHYSRHMEDIMDLMMERWDTWAREKWIPGIYLVETISGSQDRPYSRHSSAILEFEPLHALKNSITLSTLPMIVRFACNRLWKKLFQKGLFINTVPYSSVWKSILKKIPRKNPLYVGKDIIYGWLVAWDNSPRKWRDSLIVTDSTPQEFKKYFWMQYKKAKDEKMEFVFLNAWNEWAEGSYLEPDTKNNYGYLESIAAIKKENA